jgi:hypothetical protein
LTLPLRLGVARGQFGEPPLPKTVWRTRKPP